MLKGITAGMAVSICLTLPSLSMGENLQQSISAYDAIDCKPVIEQELEKYKINRSDIRNIDYYNTSFGGGERGGGLRSFQASINFHSCKGSLIFSLDSACYVERIFSTGECKKFNLPYT